MDGFLLLDKPKGLSSGQCVSHIKKTLNLKKVGHCGTLDPLATGILPICIGEATKFSSYVSNESKEYKVNILFGVRTNTGDITGETLVTKEINFNKKELMQAIDSLKGDQEQIPPMHSALKVKGKPLYSWVRRGIFLKREARKINIKRIKIKSIKSRERVDLEILCSKGTYIRTLVEAIGRKLGTEATVLGLRRTRIGLLNENNLIKLDCINNETFASNFIECDTVLKTLPRLSLGRSETKKIINGQQVDYNAREEKEGIVRLYENEGSFIGIGIIDSSMKVSPKRLLSTK